MLDSIPHQDEITSVFHEEEHMLDGCFFAFNTVIRIKLVLDDQDQAQAAFEWIVQRCRHYERLFSRTLVHSDIWRIAHAQGKPIQVDSETFGLTKAALEYCEKSNGIFDITIGSVSRLWDFKHRVIPCQKDLKKALSHVDYRAITLDDSAQSVQLLDKDAFMDLGGIAKGYITDKLVEGLYEREIHNFMLNLGGNVYTAGMKNDKSSWHVGVKNPFNNDEIVTSFALTDASAVTSGIYERCFIRNNVLYHHILHPKSGMPVATDIAGVTVIAKHSIDAEGYSTTLVALGLKKGLAFAQSCPEIQQAYFIDIKGDVYFYDRDE